MNMRCKLYLAVIRMCALNFGCNIEEFLRSTDLSLFMNIVLHGWYVVVLRYYLSCDWFLCYLINYSKVLWLFNQIACYDIFLGMGDSMCSLFVFDPFVINDITTSCYTTG